MAGGSEEYSILLLSKLAVAEKAEDAFVAAAEILLKLMRNIVQNPTEQKFRRIKPQNPTISAKLLSAPGMKEVVAFLGWQEEQGGEALVLPDEAVARLRAAVDTVSQRHYWMSQREVRENLDQRKADFEVRQRELKIIHDKMEDDKRRRESRPKAQASVATQRVEAGSKKFEPPAGG